jgi:hypothetical protein
MRCSIHNLEYDDKRACPECLRAAKTVGLINALRDTEGSIITIFNVNPEFGGPCDLILVQGTWTGNEPWLFEGESLIQCLGRAATAKNEKKLDKRLDK